MNKIKVETWAGHDIRFVWHKNDWWAVAKDVTDALGIQNASVALNGNTKRGIKGIPETEKGVCKTYTLGGEQNVAIISELGVYRLVFKSHKPEAEAFQTWVYEALKTLRKSTGLEGFEIFRMLDKEHQKEAMRRLQDGLRQPRKVDYIKANTIADKAVSSRYGHPKMVKKGDMSPEMLAEREAILDDTVQLMALNDKYGMGISVSQTIYHVKGNHQYENH